MSNKYIKEAIEKLNNSTLRVTSQRINLINILFKNGNTHFTAEEIFELIVDQGLRISLATVYNTLKQFTLCGMLKEIRISSDKMYFDTNAKPHHHFYHQNSGKLEDIHIDEIKIKKRPKIPRGCKLDSIEVLINLD